MRIGVVALLGVCVACSSGPTGEEISVTLPDAPAGAIFAVLNVNASKVVGQVGSAEALEGPTVQVSDPESVFVLTFSGGLFGGYRGPDQVYETLGDDREGLDAVRVPAPNDVYALTNGALETMPGLAQDLADSLRVPCDTRTASTRPAFEEDPDPRCPSGSRATQALVSCQDLMSTRAQRRTVITESATFEVMLEQRGCRVDMTCAPDASCPSSVPMFSVLGPRLAADGDEAMTTFASVADRSALCRRSVEDGTYGCPDGSTFRIE